MALYEDLQVKPFSEMIQRTVSGCTKAQRGLLDIMLNYVKDSTFTKKGGKNELAMLHFSFEAGGRQYEIKIPLITVIPPQCIQIRDVEINFNAVFWGVEESKEDKVKKRVYLYRFAPSRRVVRTTESSFYDLRNVVNVNIKAADLGISGGMSRLLELASTQAFRVRTVEDHK